MVFAYNQNKRPERPECELNIANPRESNKLWKKVNAFADTGADMTVIPKEVIERLEELETLTQGERIQCRGVNGSRFLETYIVDLTIGDYNFDNLEVIAIPGRDYALIGRDILNRNKASFNATQDCWRLNCGGNCE